MPGPARNGPATQSGSAGRLNPADPLRRTGAYLTAAFSSFAAVNLGTVRAADADEAVKVAIREFGITDPQRQRRLAAQPMAERG